MFVVDMKATTDGKKLLALLFNADDTPLDSGRQIRTLFAAMDSDSDEVTKCVFDVRELVRSVV